MLKALTDALHRILDTTARAAIRTPVEVALAVAVALGLSLAIENVIDSKTLFRWALPAGIAWLLTFGISNLHALKVIDSSKRWILTTAYVTGCALYAGFFFDIELISEAWRWGLWATGAFIGVTLVPLLVKLGDATPSERFWRFNVRLLFRASVAIIFTVGIYVGLSIALVAVQELFDIQLSDNLFGHMAAVIFVAGGPWILAGGLDDITRLGDGFHPEGMTWLARLGMFIFIPMMSLYMLIMYAYLFKVASSGVAPSNILSPLALGAGALGYAGMFALMPFAARQENAFIAWVLRFFPVAFIPVLPLPVWAIAERINQYGWTEFRYIRLLSVVCLGIFSVIGAVQFIRRKPFSLTTAPVILGVAALMASIGPWGALNVSEKSQLNRFVQAAETHGLMGDDGKLIVLTESRDLGTWENRNAVYEPADYLVQHFGHSPLDRYSPVDLSNKDRWEQLNALGLNHLQGTHQSNHIYARIESQKGLTIPGAGVLQRVYLYHNGQAANPSSVGERTYSVVSNRILVQSYGKSSHAELKPLINRMIEHGSTNEHYTFGDGENVLDVRDNDGKSEGYFIIENMQIRHENGEWRVESVSGYSLF